MFRRLIYGRGREPIISWRMRLVTVGAMTRRVETFGLTKSFRGHRPSPAAVPRATAVDVGVLQLLQTASSAGLLLSALPPS